MRKKKCIADDLHDHITNIDFRVFTLPADRSKKGVLPDRGLLVDVTFETGIFFKAGQKLGHFIRWLRAWGKK